MKVGLPADFLCLMERILNDEVVKAMQHVGWGEFTQPQPRTHAVATKPPGNSLTPKSSRRKPRPVSMQGVTYSDGKKIIGRDLGIEPLNADVYFPKMISELCRDDMRN